MKLRYDALLTAAQVLRLDANMTSYGRRRDMLEEVANALLCVANGTGVIEMEMEIENVHGNL